MEQATMESPLGFISIRGNDEGISEVYFDEEALGATPNIPDALVETVLQLNQYFEGKRTQFQLALKPFGTDFQQKVWKELLQIPFGSHKSYLDIAKKLGDPKVIRAAASANGKNPIAIVIPCHRVIGSNGELTGYAGGLHRKKWLLEHESPVKQGKLF